jgi:hypothetical protein
LIFEGFNPSSLFNDTLALIFVTRLMISRELLDAATFSNDHASGISCIGAVDLDSIQKHGAACSSTEGWIGDLFNKLSVATNKRVLQALMDIWGQHS